MEKTEDFNVFELQELVIKHNCGKKHTSLAQKSMIVKSHLLNHVPLEQLSKDFGVSVRSIRRWISTFAAGKVPQKNSPDTSYVKPNPSIMPKKIQKPVETEAEELARLREENMSSGGSVEDGRVDESCQGRDDRRSRKRCST